MGSVAAPLLNKHPCLCRCPSVVNKSIEMTVPAIMTKLILWLSPAEYHHRIPPPNTLSPNTLRPNTSTEYPPSEYPLSECLHRILPNTPEYPRIPPHTPAYPRIPKCGYLGGVKYRKYQFCYSILRIPRIPFPVIANCRLVSVVVERVSETREALSWGETCIVLVCPRLLG